MTFTPRGDGNFSNKVAKADYARFFNRQPNLSNQPERANLSIFQFFKNISIKPFGDFIGLYCYFAIPTFGKILIRGQTRFRIVKKIDLIRIDT